ncbi:hypothetical protein CJ030_MR0G025148 [Morella rubra]|uniref:Uncharacterized protein n=1 Tax=Morella rubra TaxID=262757 RepID=A0A6A1UGB7_9ROSI|nr:hypothetical protein CJ030_MR0G025186 [Morella rubra]KAB1199329.1 hypothetical protein CJ030_MR0G025148 [Morella rubra]
MAEVRARAVVVCDDICGCAVPCPGGADCRCTTSEAEGTMTDHKTCSCGKHCSCNPCTCPKREETTGAPGRTSCQCGIGCTCESCRA